MKPFYRSFLLRLWQAGTPEKPAWRASLEDTRTRQVVGFDDLGRLNEYLQSLDLAPDDAPEVHDRNQGLHKTS
jgi:hypothetical protein